jgi:hypothetical protein
MTSYDMMCVSVADDDKFVQVAKEINAEVAGPSAHGSFLLKEENGKVWLFSRPRKSGTEKFGVLENRVYVPSVWTELNISIMGGIR